MSNLYQKNQGAKEDRNPLAVEFCGIICENPFFLSSSCVSQDYEMCARALEMGWAGVVWKTVGIYRPVEISPRFDAWGGNGQPFSGFRNLEQISDRDYHDNFQDMARLKKDFPDKVVIASVMGRGTEEWGKLAENAASAKVDAIEVNISCPQMGSEDMGDAVAGNLAEIRQICQIIKERSSLPLFVKLPPEGNIELAAQAALSAGADGITAVNTVPSLTTARDCSLPMPDIFGKSAIGGYSGRAVKPIAMRQVATLAGSWENVPIHATGGCTTWKDAADFLSLGAATVQITTAVMEYGYRVIEDFVDGLTRFLCDQGYASVEELKGTALTHLTGPEDLMRGIIRPARINQSKCIGCGRCYLSCRDGGHQAISWESSHRRASILTDRCVGCGLCRLVCPAKAITHEDISFPESL